MTAFKKIAATSVMLGVLMPAFAFAQTPSGVQALLDQIKALQAQMKSIQEQQQSLAQQQKTLVQDQKTAIVSLARALRQGSSGEDVTALQALLAADPSVYPEGTISGYYGRLTAEAVKRFQKKHGIEQVGNVGPKTLKKLNEFLRENPLAWQMMGTSTATSTMSTDKRGRPCAIVPPGHLIAPGWLKKHKDDDKPVVPPCQVLPGGIEKKLGEWDREENKNDKTAPVISAVSSSNITATTANINWTTNEPASNIIEYGTSTAYGMQSQSIYQLSGVHAVMLSNLTPSTVYNYRIKAWDLKNNTATSSNMTFTTASVDVAAPVISAISVSPLASTTATINWTTNEAANGKVYYSTVFPIDLGTALTVNNAAYTTGHAIVLPSLSASTTYHYVIESKDGSNNTATTSPASFVTTN